MRRDDFFKENAGANPFSRSVSTLDKQLIGKIHKGTTERPDAEVGVALAHLVHDEFRDYGSGHKSRLNNDESRGIMAALIALFRRLNVSFRPEYMDFEDFERHWKRNGMSGSYAPRVDALYDLFNPVHEKLADLEAGLQSHGLATPVTTHSRTGWTAVDEEVNELRRHFQDAQSPQDYRNIGNDCVKVLECLSEAAYIAERHAIEGEDPPPVPSTKARLTRVVEVDLEGSSNVELRKLIRAAIEQAQAVKHRTPTRRQAGIAGDSVIMLANILRRLAEPEG